MTLPFERILYCIGGTFTAFCMFSVLFGELAALWLARVATIGGLIAVVAYAVTHATGAIKWSVKQQGHEARKAAAELKKAEAEATRAARESEVAVHRLHGPGMMLAVDHTGAVPQISNFGYHPPEPDHSRGIHPDHPPALPDSWQGDPPETCYPVMPYIQNALSLVLIGPQGTGKTTLLQHVIDSRAGESIIIDPHGYRGKYPAHARIIGEGRNYDEIQACMDDILDQLNERYEAYQGQEFPPLWIYIDELTLLHKHTENFQQFMMVMLTEARKVGMKLTVCVHSRRVKFMGLDRAGDLADGVLWVNLKNVHGTRWAELEYADREPVKCSLPGPFPADEDRRTCRTYRGCRAQTTATDHDFGGCDRYDTRDKHDKHDTATPQTGIPYFPDQGTFAQFHEPGPKRFYESATERDIVAGFEAGVSVSKLAKKHFGYSNGGTIQKVKSVLSKHGVS